MSLNEKLTALATSIRTKSGVSGSLSLDAMKTAVDSITTGGGGGSSDDEEWYQEPPNDGKTRLYIDVAQEHRKNISIKCFLADGTSESNDINLDWGDGSSTILNTYGNLMYHTYQKLGKYILTVNAPTNSVSFNSLGYYEENLTFCEKVRKIYLGTDISSTLSTIGAARAPALLSFNIGGCRAPIEDYFLNSYILNQDTLDLSQNDFYKTDYGYIFYSGIPTINTYKLPKNIATIGNYKQVYGYYIYFPSGLTSIGSFLTVGNYKEDMKELHFASTTPPTIQANTFGSSDYAFNSTCKIIVPAGCGEAYKAATNWAKYADQIVEETTDA